VVGKRESAERAVSIRRLGSSGQTAAPLFDALEALAEEALPPDRKRVPVGSR
jgi:threonyl-tRNA synthetase